MPHDTQRNLPPCQRCSKPLERFERLARNPYLPAGGLKFYAHDVDDEPNQAEGA